MKATRYELPSEGNTLLGYVVRRMHKTHYLAEIPALLAESNMAQALVRIGLYAAASSTSFGPAYYQPEFNQTGEIISEADPETGALITAKLESRSPHYVISYSAVMPNDDTFSGGEEITGTTIGLRGLGMPAPSMFTFTSGKYSAEMTGVITSELMLSLIGNRRIRAYGFLNLEDNAGNAGKLQLERNGNILIQVGDLSEKQSLGEIKSGH
ncbi:MAG: hypothetical protein WAN58_19480 [Anaerolineales bacterium]